MRVRTDDGRERHRHLRGHRRPPPPVLPRHRRARVPPLVTGLPIADTPEALTPAWLTRRARPPAVTSTDGHIVEAIAAAARHGPDVRQLPRRAPLRAAPTARRQPRWSAKLPSADPTSRSTAVSTAQLRERGALLPAARARACPIAHARPCTTPTSTRRRLASCCCSRTWRRRSRATSSPAATPSSPSIAVDELVKLARPPLGRPHARRARVAARRPDDGALRFMAMLLPTLWDGFRERYSDRPRRRTYTHAGDALFADLERYLTPSDGRHAPSCTATTASTTSSSTRRRRHPGAVVDWQTCTHGPALNDVAYFIGAGLLRRRPPRRRSRARAPATTTRLARRRASPATPPGLLVATTAVAPSPGSSWPWLRRCSSSAPIGATRCS